MKKIIVIFIAAFVFFTGCDLTAPQRYKEQMSVITGLLHEGQYIDQEHPIFVGKAISATDADYSELFHENAIVMVYEQNFENVNTDSLQLTFLPDSGFFDQDNYLLIKSGHYYTIEAVIGNKIISAITFVPQPMSVQYNEFFSEYPTEAPVMQYQEGDEFPVQMEFTDFDPVYLFIEFYCMEEFENYKFMDDLIDEDFGELKSYEYNELRKNIIMCFEFNPFPNSYGDPEVSIELGIDVFIFFGKQRVRIYSIDHNYYNYYYNHEGYKHGGIQNGLGYFGAVSGKTFYTDVIE